MKKRRPWIVASKGAGGMRREKARLACGVLGQHFDPAADGEGNVRAVFRIFQNELAVGGPPFVAAVVLGCEFNGRAVFGHAADGVMEVGLGFLGNRRVGGVAAHVLAMRRSRQRCRSCKR